MKAEGQTWQAKVEYMRKVHPNVEIEPVLSKDGMQQAWARIIHNGEIIAARSWGKTPEQAIDNALGNLTQELLEAS